MNSLNILFFFSAHLALVYISISISVSRRNNVIWMKWGRITGSGGIFIFNGVTLLTSKGLIRFEREIRVCCISAVMNLLCVGLHFSKLLKLINFHSICPIYVHFCCLPPACLSVTPPTLTLTALSVSPLCFQTHYFGLWFQGKTQAPAQRWVELEKPLKKQLDKFGNEPLLFFGVMFYVPNVSRLEQEATR